INIQHVGKSMNMQSGSIDNISQLVQWELLGSIQQVATATRELVKMAERATDAVDTGKQAMEKASDGMGEIKKTISYSAVIIQNLGQRAADIGKIVNVIESIADKTNLLSLN